MICRTCFTEVGNIEPKEKSLFQVIKKIVVYSDFLMLSLLVSMLCKRREVSWTLTKKSDFHLRGPSEIKRREMVLDSQESP